MIGASKLPRPLNRYTVRSYYFCLLFDNWSRQGFPDKGAIGFDRMAAVVVACRGRSLGPLKM